MIRHILYICMDMCIYIYISYIVQNKHSWIFKQVSTFLFFLFLAKLHVGRPHFRIETTEGLLCLRLNHILRSWAPGKQQTHLRLRLQMGVSWNGGTPKSSILMGFSLTKTIHFGVPPFMETHVWKPANIDASNWSFRQLFIIKPQVVGGYFLV